MNDQNPYSSPTTEAEPPGKVRTTVGRNPDAAPYVFPGLTAILISSLALYLRYGNPELMNPLLFMIVLPLISMASVFLTSFGMQRQINPSFKEKVLPFLGNAVVLVSSSIALFWMSKVSVYILLAVPPRLGTSLASVIMYMAISFIFYGTIRDRITLFIANGLATMLAITTITDIMAMLLWDR